MSAAEESPAAVIRRAAELMRERARSATQGPWERAGDAGEIAKSYHPNFVAFWRGEYLAGVCDTGDGSDAVFNQAARDARYIASMHPLLGAALADLLGTIAGMADLDPDLMGRVGCDEVLNIARIYLGTEDGS